MIACWYKKAFNNFQSTALNIYMREAVSDADMAKYTTAFDGNLVCTFDQCGWLVTSRVNLMNHLKQHFYKASVDELVEIYTTNVGNEIMCMYDNCGYRARLMRAVRSHVVVHLKSKPFQCCHCDFSANYRHQLRSHIDRKH